MPTRPTQPGNAGDFTERLRDPGYTPKRRDLAELLAFWLGSAGEVEKRAQLALLRRSEDLLPVVSARLSSAELDLEDRIALLRILGRIPQQTEAMRALFFRALQAEDSARVRREAIVQIGKVRASVEEEDLLLRHHAALAARQSAHADDLAEARSLVEALGKCGGERSLAVVREAETTATHQKAALRLARTSLRESSPGTIRTDVSWDPCTLHFFCRPGLETLLAEELGALGVRIRSTRTSRVIGETSGPLVHLAKARIFTHFGFAVPLPARDIPALAHVVSDPAGLVRRMLTRLTEGPLRYRLSFADGRHRRGLVWDAATAIAHAWPDATNDPTATLWDLSVDEDLVLAIPKGAWDTRFRYERPALPASTHPTLAAALTWLGSKRPADVVWDPFVGAGTELKERALRGPYRRLLGTDVSQDALDLARATLRDLDDVELFRADASDVDAPALSEVSLILTNPPMGRRVRTDGTKRLLERFAAQAGRILRKGGELVWYAPFPEALTEAASAAGLTKTRGIPVDLGGFEVELQHWVKGRPARD